MPFDVIFGSEIHCDDLFAHIQRLPTSESMTMFNSPPASALLLWNLSMWTCLYQCSPDQRSILNHTLAQKFQSPPFYLPLGHTFPSVLYTLTSLWSLGLIMLNFLKKTKQCFTPFSFCVTFSPSTLELTQ